MKMPAMARLVAAIVAVPVLGTAACGGGSNEAPPPATPTQSETPTTTDVKGTPASTDTAAGIPGTTETPSAGSAADPSEAPTAGGTGDTRNTDTIAALVKAHRKEARDCYEKALTQIPGLKGDVVIHFTLKPNGEVKQAELNEQRSTIREASVSSCVIDVIRAIPFPRSSKGRETTVNYPFNFNP
jgi:hypothetical protein